MESKKPRTLTLAELQAHYPAAEREWVAVPEFGLGEDVGVYIRPLGKGARDRIGAQARQKKELDGEPETATDPDLVEVDIADFQMGVILECVVEPRLTRAFVRQLFATPSATDALDRIVARVMEISGMAPGTAVAARRTFPGCDLQTSGEATGDGVSVPIPPGP